MGERINIFVGPKKDGETCAILYSNNSHPDVDPEALVHKIAATAKDADDFVRKCSALIYSSDGGNHRAGEPVFRFDTQPHDYEFALFVQAESCDFKVPVKVVRRNHCG